MRTRIPADLETPVSAYLKLARCGAVCLLESVERGVQVGRHSFIGLAPSCEIRLSGREVRVERDGSVSTRAVEAARPFEAVERELQRARTVPASGLPGPLGAAVGYLGWETVGLFERVPLGESGHDGLPDARFLFPSQLVAFDHVKNEIELTVLSGEHGRAEARRRLDDLLDALRSPLPARALPRPAPTIAPPVGEIERARFESLVERAREQILAGDAFQIVLSQRLVGRTAADPFTIYRALRMLNPSPYHFFLDFGDSQLIGASPEALVTLQGDRARVSPIAGTRPRGRTPEEDAALEAELLADEKELAEHSMLVDLGRNDLGRVAVPGSVVPSRLLGIERYSHVMHLVSRVEGTLREGLDGWDLLRAVFPAGTLSGAPKIRAMEIITELERRRRGPYGGAVGYVSPSGDLDLCVAIRTLVLQGDRWWVQAGAGIVADSDPAREYEETLHKADAVTRAVAYAEGGLDQCC